MISSDTTETRQIGKQTQQRLETAVRFVVLAVPGLLIFLFCTLALIAEFSYGEIHVMSPFLAVFLAVASAFMILAGTSQWRRWAYLWVFLSIPIVASIWILLLPFLPDGPPDQHGTNPKLFGLLVFAFPTILSYVIVRRHYAHKANRPAKVLPSAEHGDPGRART
jgi:hypothetical protein